MSAKIAVAVSGGRDSMALLHCLARAAPAQPTQVWALHVHHGLQPEADAWAAFVKRRCAAWAARGLPVHFAMRRLDGRPAAGQSVEAWARAGRYAALAAMARDAGCPVVALAHHQGDQAETFLLQALRGGGAAGLASMPRCVERDGLLWLRPWLDQPRDAIDAYVRRHRLRHVDDASNSDARLARNRLRQAVMPTLRAAFPEADVALARSARHAARARELIDEVARSDLATVGEGDCLHVERWLALSTPRRYEALRAWLAPAARHGVPESLLDRLMVELPTAATARWPLDGHWVTLYRGRMQWHRRASADAIDRPCPTGIDGMGLHPVPGCDAALDVQATRGEGVPLASLRGSIWQPRRGGEQFQRLANTPPRSLKKQFQAHGIPVWAREAPLLISAAGQLLFVPGLGTDARVLSARGAQRVSLEWVSHR